MGFRGGCEARHARITPSGPGEAETLAADPNWRGSHLPSTPATRFATLSHYRGQRQQRIRARDQSGVKRTGEKEIYWLRVGDSRFMNCSIELFLLHLVRRAHYKEQYLVHGVRRGTQPTTHPVTTASSRVAGLLPREQREGLRTRKTSTAHNAFEGT